MVFQLFRLVWLLVMFKTVLGQVYYNISAEQEIIYDISSYVPDTELVGLHGQEALTALGEAGLDAVSSYYDYANQSTLQQVLLNDRDLAVTREGALLYSCTGLIPLGNNTSGNGTLTPQINGQDPNDDEPPTTDAFTLHSRPGSNRVFYLDFNGCQVPSSRWGSTTAGFPGPPLTQPAFDLDNTPGFSNRELSVIIQIWRAVAADYANLDVDVTTQDPGVDALFRTSDADNNYGMRACIGGLTGNAAVDGGGGVAFLESLRVVATNPAVYWGDQPAWVFAPSLGPDPKSIADATSHELGHTLGLSHDGFCDPAVASCTIPKCNPNIPGVTPPACNGVEYYGGTDNWAPIMGGSYQKPVQTFDAGQYPFATNPQNDYDRMTRVEFLQYIADDFPDNLPNAAVLCTAPLTCTEVPPGRTSARVQGIITFTAPSAAAATIADIDSFAFDAQPGQAVITVQVVNAVTAAWYRTNFDAQAAVLDAAGTVIASSSGPELPESRTIDITLPTAGRYFIRISPIAATGQPSAYGSVGKYTLTAEFPAVPAVPPIVCVDKTVSLSLPGSCDSANVPVTDLFTGGNAAVTATATPAGPYVPGTTEVTVSNNVGLPSCIAKVVVVPCKPNCIDLNVDNCANPSVCTAPIDPKSFVTPASVGATATGITLTPASPFPIGSTATTAVVQYPGGVVSASSDQCKVTVTPCKPKCVDVTANTDTGVCTATINPALLVDAKFIAQPCALPAPNTVTLTPGNPFSLGETKPVTAVVNYQGGIVSPKSDGCTVIVADKEPPVISALDKCVVPKSPKTKSVCFSTASLVSTNDNCPNVKARITSGCEVQPLPKESLKNRRPLCTVEDAGKRLCVSFEKISQKTPRTITVTVTATDGSGNTAAVKVPVVMYAKVSKKLPGGCQQV